MSRVCTSRQGGGRRRGSPDSPAAHHSAAPTIRCVPCPPSSRPSQRASGKVPVERPAVSHPTKQARTHCAGHGTGVLSGCRAGRHCSREGPPAKGQQTAPRPRAPPLRRPPARLLETGADAAALGVTGAGSCGHDAACCAVEGTSMAFSGDYPYTLIGSGNVAASGPGSKGPSLVPHPHASCQPCGAADHASTGMFPALRLASRDRTNGLGQLRKQHAPGAPSRASVGRRQWPCAGGSP